MPPWVLAVTNWLPLTASHRCSYAVHMKLAQHATACLQLIAKERISHRGRNADRSALGASVVALRVSRTKIMEQAMTGSESSGLRRKLMSMLTAAAMVVVYLLGTIGVSTVTMTAGTSSAEARGRRGGRRGRRGRGRRGRRGRGRVVRSFSGISVSAKTVLASELVPGASGSSPRGAFSFCLLALIKKGILLRNRCAGWLQTKYSNLIKALISMVGVPSDPAHQT